MTWRLDAMRDNPAAGWTIADVAAVCRDVGANCVAPRGCGSHYRVSHPALREKLTVPYRRPIKPIYIRHLVAFIDAVRQLP